MSSENFTVHLVSNVSPDIFPNNNPAEFSTILANEINLNDGNWEVAVREIMYLTHVATTSKDDRILVYKYSDYYRKLLPHPPRNSQDLNTLGATINVDRITSKSSTTPAPTSTTTFTAMTDTNETLVAELLMQAINKSKWSAEKEIFKLEFKKKIKKFILHVYHEDILVILSENLRKCLGFKHDTYTKGEHWAWSAFESKNVALRSKLIFLCDLQVLESEQHKLLLSYDSANRRQFYEKTIPYKFHDTLPDEYYEEPTFSFGVYPNEGRIKIKAIKPIPQIHKRHENRFVFFRFDSNARKLLKLEDVYTLIDKDEITIPIVPRKGEKSAKSAKTAKGAKSGEDEKSEKMC